MVPSNADFEAADLLTTYLFYDGPQFFSASVRDRIFVFLAVADDLWVCKELPNVETLIHFEEGAFDGRDLFLVTEGRLFLWQSYSLKSQNTSVVETSVEEVAENRWHVSAGLFFKIREN